MINYALLGRLRYTFKRVKTRVQATRKNKPKFIVYCPLRYTFERVHRQSRLIRENADHERKKSLGVGSRKTNLFHAFLQAEVGRGLGIRDLARWHRGDVDVEVPRSTRRFMYV